MPSDPPVLIITGPPGAGKTTTAAALAARFPRAVHLESDRFFEFIHSDYVEPWKPESAEQNQVVMRIVAEAAAGYAAAGYFTVIDGIVIPGWFLEPVRDALREAGHDVALAVLRAPMAICVERVQEREGGPSVDAAALEQLWRSFDGIGELEANVLELDRESSDQISEMLARRLDEGLLRI
ncbi:MAG: AAA family ATPase [Solirubrobacterales bacterium]